MKKLFIAYLLLSAASILPGQIPGTKPEPVNTVSDKIYSYSPNSIKIEG